MDPLREMEEGKEDIAKNEIWGSEVGGKGGGRNEAKMAR